MNLPQNISLEHRWIANPAAAKGRAIFFGVIALLLLAFTIYAFSGARQAVWQNNLPNIRTAATATVLSTEITGHRPSHSYETGMGIWNYNMRVDGLGFASLTPSGPIGILFAPSFSLLLPAIGERIPTHRDFWFWPATLGRDVYLLMTAVFAVASLYCTIIHTKSRKSGNLPLDDDIKLCK